MRNYFCKSSSWFIYQCVTALSYRIVKSKLVKDICASVVDKLCN